MIKYLPRHTFGYMQSKLFPKYFLLGVVLSGASLATFLIDNPISGWGFQQKIQVLCKHSGDSQVAMMRNVLYTVVYHQNPCLSDYTT